MDKFEYRIIRFSKNTYMSPLERAYNFGGGKEEGGEFPPSEVSRLFDSDEIGITLSESAFSGIKDKGAQIYLALTQSWDIVTVTPHNELLGWRELCMLPSVNDNGFLVGSLGEVSESEHAMVLYRNLDEQAKANANWQCRDYLGIVEISVLPEQYNDQGSKEALFDEINSILERNVNGLDADATLFYSLYSGDFVALVNCFDPALIFKIASSLNQADVGLFTYSSLAMSLAYEPKTRRFDMQSELKKKPERHRRTLRKHGDIGLLRFRRKVQFSAEN